MMPEDLITLPQLPKRKIYFVYDKTDRKYVHSDLSPKIPYSTIASAKRGADELFNRRAGTKEHNLVIHECEIIFGKELEI